MIDAKGVWLRPRRLRTKIEQSAPESLTRLSSRFVLIHMWWGEELKPLDSVQLDANPRRGRNSVIDGRQTSVRKPIPSCQAQTPPPYAPLPCMRRVGMALMLNGKHTQRAAAVAGVERGLAAATNCVASRIPWPNGV